MFRAGGSKQFFHGGLSPQELVVPVIVVDTEPAPAPKKLQVDVSIAGGRITTGAFAATVGFTGDLFTSEITVRVVAQGSEAEATLSLVSCLATVTTRPRVPWLCGPTDRPRCSRSR